MLRSILVRMSTISERMSSTAPDLTQLLLDLGNGRADAEAELFPFVYQELQMIARMRLRQHQPSATLDTVALIHEAYLRIIDQTSASWENRAHFFAVASRAMRFIIIDYARKQSAEKRGGGKQVVSLDEAMFAVEDRAAHLVALDEALAQLSEQNPRLGALVEYKYFGGFSYDELAAITGRSVPTLKRDWARARAWLYHSMSQANP